MSTEQPREGAVRPAPDDKGRPAASGGDDRAVTAGGSPSVTADGSPSAATGEDWLVTAALAPQTDHDPLAPLYEAAARGELALPFCGACRLPLELEQRVCDRCGSARVGWEPTDPHGTVHAVTTMHRLEPGLVHTTTPYPLLDVETRGGHRLIMTTIHPARPVPRIGDAVAIGFRSVGGVAIPAADSPARSDTEDRS